MRLHTQRAPEGNQHPGVASQRWRGELFPDLLRNEIFQFRVPFEKADEVMIDSRHSGIDFERESVPVLDPTLKALSGELSRPKLLEERMPFYLLVVGVENNFSQRGDLFLCFRGTEFDMFGHLLCPPIQKTFIRRAWPLSTGRGSTKFWGVKT